MMVFGWATLGCDLTSIKCGINVVGYGYVYWVLIILHCMYSGIWDS